MPKINNSPKVSFRMLKKRNDFRQELPASVARVTQRSETCPVRCKVAFECVDKGRGRLLNFKQFLEALQFLRVGMPYHHRLALFANSDSDQDGLITGERV